MKRFALLLAMAAVFAIPGQASAIFRCWWAHNYAPYAYGYAYPAPRFQPYVVPLYVAPGVPMMPPQVYPVIPKSPSPKAEAPTAPLKAPTVTITPNIVPPMAKQESVTPASGVATPMPAPAPMNNPITIPDPMVPKSPNSDAKPVTPSAIPSAAPAPGNELPMIPLPEPKKTTGTKDELPPLVLPPETGGSPSGVIPPVISKSSPLTGAVKFQVFTAAGEVKGTLRKVGFFNHTDRDLDLIIAGKSVKLPKKSYVNAELPAKFTWKLAGAEAESATVPDGAAGLDVLFKE